jgi:hypothetical protein
MRLFQSLEIDGLTYFVPEIINALGHSVNINTNASRFYFSTLTDKVIT